MRMTTIADAFSFASTFLQPPPPLAILLRPVFPVPLRPNSTSYRSLTRDPSGSLTSLCTLHLRLCREIDFNFAYVASPRHSISSHPNLTLLETIRIRQGANKAAEGAKNDAGQH